MASGKRAHPQCKNLSNSRMTKNKENKRAKRPLNNNQTPARAKKTKKKCHRFLHRGKPGKGAGLVSSKMFCPLLLIPRTSNVFKRFYYWAIRRESLWKAAYHELQGTHCGGRHHSKLKVFKISRRPSHPTVTFIFETPIFTLVNSQNK